MRERLYHLDIICAEHFPYELDYQRSAEDLLFCVEAEDMVWTIFYLLSGDYDDVTPPKGIARTPLVVTNGRSFGSCFWVDIGLLLVSICERLAID